MATWNVTGDHIPEIVEIRKKRKIAVLGISDSRTKGFGSKDIDSNFVYTCMEWKKHICRSWSRLHS